MKRNNLIRISTAIGTGVAMMLIYFVFLTRYVAVADLSNLTQIEKWVFATLVIRLVVLVALKSRFHLQPMIPILLFSVESLLIPPLLLLYLTTGNPAYAVVMGTILTAWMGASAIVVSPYIIYSIARSMLDYASLLGVLALSGLEFGYYLFLAMLVSEASSPIVGFTGLGVYLVGSLKNQVTTVGVPLPSSTNYLIAASSVLFFISLMLYSTMGVHNIDTKIRLSYALLIPLLAIIIALTWVFILGGVATWTGYSFSSNLFFATTLPTLVLAVIIWSGTRGKD